jgi:N-hydroxyarylamine O-acetyltransferase
MYSVPFENLDITLGRPIVLSLPSIYAKIVERGRGGFCYELNGLFAWLLRSVGFTLDLLSARVFNGTAFGPEFDHILLLVRGEETVIADVGFGDSFVEPLHLGTEEQAQDGSVYRLVQNENWVLQKKDSASGWQPQYSFSLEPRVLADFEAMCEHQQSSPKSVFTKKSVCSLATSTGRVTLSNGRLIESQNGHRREHLIEDPDAYRALLKVHFAMDLGDHAKIETLMNA